MWTRIAEHVSAMSNSAVTNTTLYLVVTVTNLNCRSSSRHLNLTESFSMRQKIATLTTLLCISKTAKYVVFKLSRVFKVCQTNSFSLLSHSSTFLSTAAPGLLCLPALKLITMTNGTQLCSIVIVKTALLLSTTSSSPKGAHLEIHRPSTLINLTISEESHLKFLTTLAITSRFDLQQ